MEFDEIDIDSYYKCLSNFGCRVLTNVLKTLKDQVIPGYNYRKNQSTLLNNIPSRVINAMRQGESLQQNSAEITDNIIIQDVNESINDNVSNVVTQHNNCEESFQQNNADITENIIIQDVNNSTNDTVVRQKVDKPKRKKHMEFNSFKAPPRKPKNMESSAINLLSLNSNNEIHMEMNDVSNLVPESAEKFCLTEYMPTLKNSVTRKDKVKSVDDWLVQINNDTNEINHSEPPKKKKLPEIQTQIMRNENGKMSYGKKTLSKSESSHKSNPKENNKTDQMVKYDIETINGNAYDILSEKFKTHQPEEICFTILFKEGVCQLTINKDLFKNDESFSPAALMFYIKWHDEEKFYSMPIRRISKEEKLKQKLFIQLMMSLRTRIICFDVQETIITIIDLYKFKRSEVALTWLLIDPKICLFLLNPDDTPQTFSDILIKLSIDFEPQNQSPQINCAHLLNFLSKASFVAYKELQKNNLWELYINLEIFITPILAIMEIQGIHINTQTFNENSAVLKNYLEALEKEIFHLSGEEFVINSPNQVANILYEKLKLDSKYNINIEDTKSSKFKSTSEANLKKLSSFHPLPNLILEYRQFFKAKGAFIDSILKMSSSGTIRSTWDQTCAATGRITSSNPNLQAIPKEIANISHIFDDSSSPTHSHLEKFLCVNLRDGFIARPLHTLIAADFQNIECRIFAHLSNDSNLIDLFKSNVDIFEVLSRKWLNKKPSEEVLTSERMITKKLVYALMYGAGYRKICEILKKDYKQVSYIVSKFYEFFPGLKLFGSNILEQCRRENNTLKSLSGRKRFFHNINSPNLTVRRQTERQAINFVIQGSAADICKKTMIVFEQYCAKYSDSVEYNLLLQIHDELVWEVPDKSIDLFINAIKEVANHIDKFFEGISVPFPVLIKTGKSWGSLNTIN